MLRNRAISGFPFLLMNSLNGEPVETGTPAGFISVDGGDQTPLTGDFTHKGYGQWEIDLTAEEMNGKVIGLLFLHEDAVPVHFTINTEPALGPGAIEWAYTLTNSITGLPIADADVWVTTDITGANVIAQGKTNQNGVSTFYLYEGTVYVWRSKYGYTFTNPDTEEVTE